MLKQLAAALVVAVLAAPSAHGQGMLDRMKKRAEEAAKRKIEQRTETRAGQATDAALDKVENTVKCTATDTACIEKAKADGKTVDTSAGSASAAPAAETGATTGAAGATASGAAASLKPGQGAWANYDFKPGDKVIFADDFSQDEVGNFPRRLEFKSGSIDLVEWQGKRWLSSGNTGEFYIPLAETLPERFTLEFDLAGNGNAMTVAFDGKQTYNHHETGLDHLQFGTYFAGVKGERDATGNSGYKTEDGPVKVRIAADGDYVKVYVNEKRVANVPNAKLGRSNKIYMALNGWSEESPRMVADIRVAAGGKKLYEALASAGRVATQGIYFDTGSDRIRPESSPTLKEIGAMLGEHADLRLTIEGHTDNVGAAAANTTLSQQRADAVKAALVASYGVSADRLTAKGMGAAKPAASNETVAGRQQNRRVELVKQ